MALRVTSFFEHEGITCKSCGVSPILGPRFKCCTCIDFNLCGNCYSLPELVHNGAGEHCVDHKFLCQLKGIGKGSRSNESPFAIGPYRKGKGRGNGIGKGFGKGRKGCMFDSSCNHNGQLFGNLHTDRAHEASTTMKSNNDGLVPCAGGVVSQEPGMLHIVVPHAW